MVIRIDSIKHFLHRHAPGIVMVAVIAISAVPVKDSLMRMYGTGFWGLDVAGESLKELTEPGERIFLYTHPQGCGIARYARRYTGWTDDTEDFKRQEQRFGIRYICFFPAAYAFRLQQENKDLFAHIRDNYHAIEMGVLEGQKQPAYVIMERGKGEDSDSFLNSFSGLRRLRGIYKVFDNYIFFYAVRRSEVPVPAVQQAVEPAAGPEAEPADE
jgi:hypothetical protein